VTAARTRREVGALLERHSLTPRKRLGQHFLVDPNIVARVVRLAGVKAGDRVLEIGAGTGTLTRALAEAGGAVRSYEVDRRLEPVLAEVLAGLEVDLRFEDAMDIDLAAALTPERWLMVSNLPYDVGTPLLLRLLREDDRIERFVVMVQLEVADRLAAGPGSRVYGLPSVVAGLHATVERAFTVPARVFLPAPHVESAVVVLVRRPLADRALTEGAVAVAAAAFGQRRKMLRSSLAVLFPDVTAVLVAAGVDPTSRAEMLRPADYLTIAAAGLPAAGR
jgi:16S rRNA (adenine1518-N6/adenine1519-N6)-dimethyltransferase